MLVFRIFSTVFLVKMAAAFPQGVYIGKDGNVGASWGGYSASAGLGGLLGGTGTRGGLHASAGTPGGHFASAGLGGSVAEGSGTQGGLYSVAGQQKPVVVAQPVAPVAVIQPAQSPSYGVSSAQASSSASASASASSHGGATPVVHKRPQSSFFDDIFNIPISTLGAVNQYLNNRNKGIIAVRRPQAVQGSASFSASSSSSSASSASSSANAGASSGIDNNIYHGYQKNPNYNDIFNIPISVLGAVNKFLNGK